MKRLVIHVGMHKTGSASIQHALAKADLGPDWAYADLGGINHSTLIQSAFFRDRSLHKGHYFRNISEIDSLRLKAEHRTRLESVLRNCRPPNLIISGEGILGLTEDELAEFKATCLDLGYQPEAVAYLREPKSRIESGFCQKLKTFGASVGFDKLQKAYPRYKDRLGKFETVFGDKRFFFWNYGKEALVDGCVVKDFLSRLDITPSEIIVTRRNETLSLRAARLLYAYRRQGPAPIREDLALKHNDKLVARIGQLKGPKLTFSRAVVDPILSSNKEDIRWANSRLDTPLPSPECTDGHPGCVYSESDLYDFDPESVSWLASAIRKSPNDYSGDPGQIAMWVHALHQEIRSEAAKHGPVTARV